MVEILELGDIAISMERKNVKNVHLSVHPPTGHVTLVAPLGTRTDVARAYAIAKLGWIRRQRQRLQEQARETPRAFVTQESHYLWGRRYQLSVIEADAKASVRLAHRRIVLSVRPGSSSETRRQVMHQWHRCLLHQAAPPLIAAWETKIGAKVSRYFVQRMKTKWGSCNPRTATIRLNTELVKKPKHLLEYVIAHEVAHLIEPTHNDRFLAILNHHYPAWRHARSELNELPLAAGPRG